MSEPHRNFDWTPGSLRLLRIVAARGHTLKQLATRIGAPASEVDLALWALMGRTPGAAAIALNRRRA